MTCVVGKPYYLNQDKDSSTSQLLAGLEGLRIFVWDHLCEPPGSKTEANETSRSELKRAPAAASSAR